MGLGWQELRRDLLEQVPAAALGAPHLGMAEPKAQAWIVEQVRRGNFVPPWWWPLLIALSDNVALTVTIATEPLRLGVLGDSVRPICSGRSNGLIAGELGHVCPTAKLLDHAALTGTIVPFQASDVGDISLAHMEARSAYIDAHSPPPGVLRVGDKQWVCSSLLNHPAALHWGIRSAINYGALTTAPLGRDGRNPYKAASTSALRAYQPEAAAHDLDHTDYSQAGPQLVRRDVLITTVDGDPLELDIADVAADENLAYAISQSGPLAMLFPGLTAGGGSTPTPGGNGGGGPTTPAGHPLAGKGRLVSAIGAVGLGLGAIALGAHYHA